MENVILTVHLILAAMLIGAVLLQRSEGGGLGVGGGGGGGVMTGRQAANALSKATWILAAAFLFTSISLTVIAARNVAGNSIMDQIGVDAPSRPVAGVTDYTPPPGVATTPVEPGAPILPPVIGAGTTVEPVVDTPTEAEPVIPAPVAPPVPEAATDDGLLLEDPVPAVEDVVVAPAIDTAEAPDLVVPDSVTLPEATPATAPVEAATPDVSSDSGVVRFEVPVGTPSDQ